MTVLRAILCVAGIILLLCAVVVGFVHVAEPVTGERCFAERVTGTGQVVPVCPATQYVRHAGIAIGMGAVALGLIVGSMVGLRPPAARVGEAAEESE
ncbi:hypothetical protein KDL01_40515 [Actinospica durhamensis]|uniref:Uncharacterized protein n=1 Tax=Actinospica durhamensis TaxID=1508375 RepID=A0A941IWL2_9ACTN|nr:hypothetical protein [Actinospica durhamensis]MBR7839606.1 hypothetical protein [Actinospica durhamensis]